jgi:hypothetical protein
VAAETFRFSNGASVLALGTYCHHDAWIWPTTCGSGWVAATGHGGC